MKTQTPSTLIRYILANGYQSGVAELTNTKDLVAIHDLNDPEWSLMNAGNSVVPFLVGEDFDYLLTLVGAVKDYAESHENLHTLDAMAIVGDRWRSAYCSNTECCPTEGKPLND